MDGVEPRGAAVVGTGLEGDKHGRAGRAATRGGERLDIGVVAARRPGVARADDRAVAHDDRPPTAGFGDIQPRALRASASAAAIGSEVGMRSPLGSGGYPATAPEADAAGAPSQTRGRYS